MSGLTRAFALFTGASFIGTITQVVKGKITAVVLGPDGVGVLNQLTNTLQFLGSLAGLGFYNGMVRHMAEAWSRDDMARFRSHFRASAIVMMGAALATAAVTVLARSAISDFIFVDGGARAHLVALGAIAVPLAVACQVQRALINATRSVGLLVRCRIVADVGSVVLLAALIFPLGVEGAVLAFVGLHGLFLVATFVAIRSITRLRAQPAPQTPVFQASEVRKNLAFGLNAFLALAIGTGTLILASRLVIATFDTAANGIFTMALKVGTVFLGGVTAAAAGYLIPTMSAARDDVELHGHTNEALRLYSYFLPVIIVGLMAGGDLLILVFFTAEFLPAAALLLLILPGELLRVYCETLTVPLITRKRFVPATGTYLLWSVVYLGGAIVLIEPLGLTGVATAYLASLALRFVLTLWISRTVSGHRLDGDTARAMLLAVVLVATAALVLRLAPTRLLDYLACTGLLAVWLGLSMFDPAFRGLLEATRRKLVR